MFEVLDIKYNLLYHSMCPLIKGNYFLAIYNIYFVAIYFNQ